MHIWLLPNLSLWYNYQSWPDFVPQGDRGLPGPRGPRGQQGAGIKGERVGEQARIMIKAYDVAPLT